MSDGMYDENGGRDELERRLAAYASGRLTPDRRAVVRMRSHVLEAAHAQAHRGTPAPRLLAVRRRAATIALAAALALVGGGAVVAAAMPGGPLYGPRIWLQQLALPVGGDAREAARIAQIDDRMDDATSAVDAHDPAAVAAALEAYQDAVDAAMSDAGKDTDRIAHLREVLSKHIAVLEALRDKVPPQAVAAIDHAIAASSTALDRLESAAPTQKPEATPKPEKTQRPGRTPGPDVTPKPGKTPPGQTTGTPSGS